MSTYVVDASVAAKWFIEEEHAEEALAVLRDNEKLFAPEFFLLEMDNLVCKWIRRDIIKATIELARGTPGPLAAPVETR